MRPKKIKRLFENAKEWGYDIEVELDDGATHRGTPRVAGRGEQGIEINDIFAYWEEIVWIGFALD